MKTDIVEENAIVYEKGTGFVNKIIIWLSVFIHRISSIIFLRILTIFIITAKICRERLKEKTMMDIMEFKILNTAIERVLNKEMAELDITYTQATVIGFLNMNRHGEICQKDIEHGLGLTHPTVSSILNRLEEKKLIQTEPLQSDRRYKKIVLTEKSADMTHAIKEKIKNITEQLLDGVSEAEEIQLSYTVKRLIDNII